MLFNSYMYADVTTEKMTRGFLRSEVARRLQKTKVLIFDSVNLIKGYRYEIWCLARSASTRACLVHVDTEVDVCKEWNHGRENPYDESVFDDLASRLERPDSKNRWEAPLYTVRPTLGKEHIEYMCKEVMDYAVPIERASHGNRADCGTPVESKPVVRDLTPTLATRGQGLSCTCLSYIFMFFEGTDIIKNGGIYLQRPICCTILIKKCSQWSSTLLKCKEHLQGMLLEQYASAMHCHRYT